MAQRLTKAQIDANQGTFNPVGHGVLAFENDARAEEAAQALRDQGLAGEDILVYTADELRPRLQKMVAEASGGAGFGYEITLMRRYLEEAERGAGWLIVYTPDDRRAEQLKEAARAHGARMAVRYHRLASEDLI